MLNFVKKIKAADKTTVFFVSSHKIGTCLELLEVELNDKIVSISKELTKINEKTFRGNVIEVKADFFKSKHNFKGEFVMVVEKNSLNQSQKINLKNYEKEAYKLFNFLDRRREIVHKLTVLEQ